MNQRLIVAFEKEINNCLVQIHLPVGASWADAFAAMDEILVKIRELSVQNTKDALVEQPKEDEQPQDQPTTE
jgi:hypothetical protein